MERWADGSGRLTILRSKTDQEGKGAVVAVTPACLRVLDAIRPENPGDGDRVDGRGDVKRTGGSQEGDGHDPGRRGGNALTPRFWPENRRRRASGGDVGPKVVRFSTQVRRGFLQRGAPPA